MTKVQRCILGVLATGAVLTSCVDGGEATPSTPDMGRDATTGSDTDGMDNAAGAGDGETSSDGPGRTPEPSGPPVEGSGGPWNDTVTQGCEATDEQLDELPEELDMLGSPRGLAEELTGAWANSDGDVLTIEPATAVRLHRVEGNPAVGSAPQPCFTESYVAIEADMMLRSADGRLDEARSIEIRLFAASAQLRARLEFTSLQGTLRTSGGDEALLELSGDYGLTGTGWSLGGSIVGGDDGDNQVLVFAPFESRQDDAP